MSVVQIDLEILRSIVKESVAEAIEKEIKTFYEKVVPFVPDDEMKDIIKIHGEKPKKSKLEDMTSWFEMKIEISTQNSKISVRYK